MKLHTTHITAEGWIPSKPGESFQTFAKYIHGRARDILLEDGHHSEMFFFLPLNGEGHIVLWRNNDRDMEAEWLRQHITKHYIYGVIHVVEAWMHMAAKPGDHTIRQIMGGEIKVSELKPEDRQEVLMVSAQSRDGWAVSWVDQISRNEAGRISMDATVEFTDFRGRFGQLFG